MVNDAGDPGDRVALRGFGELFALDHDLFLYDVTSTYFEGQATANLL